jgi:hypothetical protein
MSEDRLDPILDEMRNESVPEAELKAAQDRVWRNLMAAAPGACGGFRTQFAEYRDGRLPASQRLLMDDHLSRCAACRRAYSEFRGDRKVVAMPVRPASNLRRWSQWAVAAGVALVGLYLGRGPLDRALAPSGARATVETASAGLYRLSGEPLAAGASLDEAGIVRTASGARATLRLADGSRVEMNERTTLAIKAAWSGQTIQLERGDIVVEAAKQRRGGLRVVTADSLATVRGTVFTVSSAAGGTLVGVVEGSVAVQQPGTERLLARGELAATSPALAQGGVRQAVAWSAEADKYYQLLADFAHIEKQLMASQSAALRTQSKLLALLPPEPRFYGSIPNLGGTLKQAVQLIEQRSAESAALREWWTSPGAQQMRAILDRFQSVATLLGDEVVFVGSGAATPPLIMAEVKPGQEAALQRELAALFSSEVHAPAWRLTGNLLAVSDSAAHLAAVLPTLGQGAASPFAQELAKRYARGVSWLLAADLAQRVPAAKPADAAVSGFENARYLFLEQRSVQGHEENEINLNFGGARTGVASWLAAPGPAGSAEFISSDSVLAFSSATRNPRQAYDELLAVIGRYDAAFARHIQEFESKSGIRVGDDIVSSLGADFSFSIEAPTVPIPGWFAALEVYRPAAFDDTIRRLVDAFNQALPAAERERLTVTFKKEVVNGREWISVKSAVSQLTIHWTHDRGYLVLAMDRAIANKALATRGGGFPLIRSTAYRQMLPSTAGVHQSAFFWLNPQGALSPFASFAPNPSLKQMLESREPILLVINGEKERIQAASRTRLTSLLFDALAMGASGRKDAAAPAPARTISRRKL